MEGTEVDPQLLTLLLSGIEMLPEKTPIRVAARAHWLKLPHRRRTVPGLRRAMAAGPIGWFAEPEPEPVCDECLKQRNGQFAVVLELANFFRELGETECDSEGEEDELENFLTGMGGQAEALFLRPVAPQTSLSVARLYELLEKIEERNERMGAPEVTADSLGA